MINHILLVATREFRQIAATRSFWVTLLIIPLALAIGPLAGHFLDKSKTETVMLIDPAEREAPAIAARLDLDHQRDVLDALSRYAQRHDLDHADPRALWAQHDRYYADAEVQAFVAQGGQAHALAEMKPAFKPGTPPFNAPDPDFRVVPTPPAIAAAAPAKLDDLLKPLLNPKGKNHPEALDYAIAIPADFGAADGSAKLWSADRPDGELMQAVQTVLTRDLRLSFLRAQGLTPQAADASAVLAPRIAIDTPPAGSGHEQMVVASIVPLLLAYILLMSLMLSGSWMLQGTVEERSNKLIETVLACISPNELLYGKLFGTVAVGLTMVAVWVLCAIGAAFATQGVIADFLRPALAPLTSPGIVLAMIYFFIAGYLMVSMIFLAIGAMSDSFRDAQAYLSPVMLVIAMPFAIVAQMVLRDPNSFAVQVMTWIPIYTPFTMLERLGAGVPLWEVLGAGAVLAAFIVVEFIGLGRVFRASLLASGDKPSWAKIGRLMTRSEAA